MISNAFILIIFFILIHIPSTVARKGAIENKPLLFQEPEGRGH